MEIIRKWFENDHEKYEIGEYDKHLEAKTVTVLYLIVAPYDDTRDRWLLRIAALSSFDRWANSTAIEKSFNTDVELRDYLDKHQLDIYKRLLEDISEDYAEIINDI